MDDDYNRLILGWDDARTNQLSPRGADSRFECPMRRGASASFLVPGGEGALGAVHAAGRRLPRGAGAARGGRCGGGAAVCARIVHETRWTVASVRCVTSDVAAGARERTRGPGRRALRDLLAMPIVLDLPCVPARPDRSGATVTIADRCAAAPEEDFTGTMATTGVFYVASRDGCATLTFLLAARILGRPRGPRRSDHATRHYSRRKVPRRASPR